MLNEQLLNKWQPVLDHADLPKITDPHKRSVTAQMLEQQEIALRETAIHQGEQSLLGESTVPTNVATDGTNAVKTFDPVLISLVRRTAPQLIAFDVMGVQPMSGPSGLVFALRAKYGDQGAEALFNEANTHFASDAHGTGSQTSMDANTFFHSSGDGNELPGGGITTTVAEAMGGGTNPGFAEMSFTIDKFVVVAQSRALKAEYSTELAQDLKAVHGLDAETELANILTTEINAEINRELVRTIYTTATKVATVNAATGTSGNLDGRWLVERFKALVFKLETEANAIGRATRRGKGNIILCSSDVASALATAGVMDPTPALTVDNAGSTFAGSVNGIKVYIDPYSLPHSSNVGRDFAVVGYKGASPYDAGIFYCPYVPLQMVKAIGEDNFQPKIGFKTRYGLAANPFAVAGGGGAIDVTKQNLYYRGFEIRDLSGLTS